MKPGRIWGPVEWLSANQKPGNEKWRHSACADLFMVLSPATTKETCLHWHWLYGWSQHVGRGPGRQHAGISGGRHARISGGTGGATAPHNYYYAATVTGHVALPRPHKQKIVDRAELSRWTGPSFRPTRLLHSFPSIQAALDRTRGDLVST